MVPSYHTLDALLPDRDIQPTRLAFQGSFSRFAAMKMSRATTMGLCSCSRTDDSDAVVHPNTSEGNLSATGTTSVPDQNCPQKGRET
eukprot:753449-Hanusia_phi.AAC.1